MIHKTFLAVTVLLFSSQYSTSSIAQQRGASLRSWQVCHGAEGTKGIPRTQKVDACEEIIESHGALNHGYSGSLNYSKDSLREKQVHQLLMAHRDRMLNLVQLDRYEEALDDCNEIQRLLPNASELVRAPVGWHGGYQSEGWHMKIVLLKKLGRLNEALLAIEDLKQIDLGGLITENYDSGLETKGDIEVLQGNYAAAKVSYTTYAEKHLRFRIGQAEMFLKDRAFDFDKARWQKQLRSSRENETSVKAKIAQMDRNLQSGSPLQTSFPEKITPRPEPIRGPQTEGCRLFPSLC